ncbi:MAG: helix-turn-helix domain-containing protein, partial [Comamonadaceae bacterium]
PAANGAAHDAGACIWVIEKGHLALELPSGLQARFGPGTVLLWDSLQLPRGHWDHARFSYVRLSPLRHRQILRHTAFFKGRSTRRLEQHALAPFLTAQVHTFAAHASTLSATELGEVVDGIVNVAESLLKGALAPLAEECESPQAARLQAVHRYIERNLHRSDLSVAHIARETSMSRAQLYRLFATQDASVQGTLREKRLQKSLAYLKQPQTEMQSIGAIAHACGFSDPSAFSKMFRQRFKLAPRDVRTAHSSNLQPQFDGVDSPLCNARRA